MACFAVGYGYDGTGSTGNFISSCNALSACEQAGLGVSDTGSTGNIVDSCNAQEACYQAGFGYGGTGSTEDIVESCNATRACFQLGYNSVIDGNLGDCCNDLPINDVGVCEGKTSATSLPCECFGTCVSSAAWSGIAFLQHTHR